jgi:hypothetical protein
MLGVRKKKGKRIIFFYQKKNKFNDFTMHKTIPFKFGIAVAIVVLI